jgi:DNA-binding PadR family transcriptional regulator
MKMLNIELEILSVLKQNGEMYGLEIIDTLNQKLGKN